MEANGSDAVSAASVLAGPRQRVCEKMILDNPEAMLSKTPEEILAVTSLLQQGLPYFFAVAPPGRDALLILALCPLHR